MGNRITPYKGREIDYSLPVYIYRNLNSKALSYSIRQNGLVVAHTDAVAISKASFVVSESGRRRVIQEKRKNIHAFIKGHISSNGVMGACPTDSERIYAGRPLPAKVSYNPYSCGNFIAEVSGCSPYEVKGANGVIINKKGVFAAYTERA